MSDHATTLSRLIATHTARLTVIGQGYVGLPLAVEFAKAGFTVTGLDNDVERVTALATGRSQRRSPGAAQIRTLSRDHRGYRPGGERRDPHLRSDTPREVEGPRHLLR